MNKINEKSHKNISESDLNFYNLLETTYCLLKAYTVWIYINFLRVTKIDKFIHLVDIFYCNVKARIYNNYSQRKNLLIWIKTKIKDPISVTNFREDWKDGIALCALMEGVVPGSCPRYDLLNKENAMENLNLGLSLVRKHLNIDSPIESQEIHDCKEEAKLVYLLSKVKFESIKLFMKSLLKRPIIEKKDSLGNNQKMFESLFGEEKACFAKGMGLILGVRTRKARFNIFCKPTPKLRLMIEISGPNKTMCSERISVYNPKKRVSADVVTTSVIADYLNRNKTSEDVLKIPFFYEIFSNRIVVTYIPLMKGIHKLSIIWQGQHIMNSPYTVKVEDCGYNHMRDYEQNTSMTSPTKFIPGLQWPVSRSRSDSLSLENCGTVVSRKVLKQRIIINGRQQTIEEFDTSDKINEESQTGDHLEDNDFSSSKNYDKILISKSPSNSPKLEKHLINEFNRNTNLFDIKECDSLSSDKLSSNDPKENYQNIDQSDHKHELQVKETQEFDDSSDSIDESIDKSIIETNLNEKRIVSNTHQIVSKPPHYRNQNIVNNINYRSYIPVKNMIQNWEMKLTKNINEISKGKDIDKTLPKSQIPCILVKNRKEVFEKNISTVHKSDSNESNSTINSSKDENKILPQIIVNECQTIGEDPKQSNEDINRNINSEQKLISKSYAIESESDLKSPESQTDSGIIICSHHIFPDFDTHIQKNKLSRRRSVSYPELRSHDNRYSSDEEKDQNINRQLNEMEGIGTQTSSISGLYIDDEIPDYSNLFLGNYVSYTGLLNAETPLPLDDIDFNNIFETENDLNANKVHDLGIYPEKCEVFGAGAYYGQVGVKNHFVVSTKDGGRSYLAVGVQSTEFDDVLEVSFTSIGQNKYEIQYEVSRPGYYVIFVKWGDYNIADSPFICKVTY